MTKMHIKNKGSKKIWQVILFGGALLVLCWWFAGRQPEVKPLHQPAIEVSEPAGEVETVEKEAVDRPVEPKEAVLTEREAARQAAHEESVPVSRSVTSRFAAPAKGEISSLFGQRWGRKHDGVDIANDEGTPIVAAMDGKVSYAGWISGYGNTVMIEHKHGYTTLYGHMKTILTEAGAFVESGQLIGKMGSTGNSTGPHVHFEIKREGTPMDPLAILPE